MQEHNRPGLVERRWVIDLTPSPWTYESVTYQMIIEEGIERGEAPVMRRLLINQGTAKFGPPDSATTATIERVTALDALSRLSVSMLTAASWDELLASL